MEVRVVDHPLAAARLTTLRDERTSYAAFRAALLDLTLILSTGPPATHIRGSLFDAGKKVAGRWKRSE
jgi:hypothetical protein